MCLCRAILRKGDRIDKTVAYSSDFLLRGYNTATKKQNTTIEMIASHHGLNTIGKKTQSAMTAHQRQLVSAGSMLRTTTSDYT